MTSLWFSAALLPTGWATGVRVTIADGRIAAVVSGIASEPGEERHPIGLPGLPNLHSHAFQRAMAGLTEERGAGRDSFWTWRELMYRFAGRLNPDLLEAIAALAFVEMLERGFTRVGEFHYVHHQPSGWPYADLAAMAAAIAAAAETSAIGLTLLPVFYAHGGFGDAPLADRQRRFACDLDRFATLVDASERTIASLPDAILGVAPHSLRATSPAELTALASLRPGAPLHIHIAEQVQEVDDCVAWSGQRPVAWLYDHAEPDERWCLVHATHITDDERATIASSGAVVGLCPITEANLGDGIFPADAFARAGGRWGIGSDSNVAIDAAGELRMLEYGQRLRQRERNVLAIEGRSTGRPLFDTALAGGARALGVGSGGIVVGASADLVSLDPDHLALVGRHGDAWLDGLIFGATDSPVDRVWRRGRCVVIDGRHVARAAVVRRYREALAQLLHDD